MILFFLVTLGVVGIGRAQAPNDLLQPTAAELPGWLRQGKIRFARFDGGPIEVQKAIRSSWGKQFNPQAREVLGNLYGKYGDHMVDLLKQAHVNFVWVTYSVGFSWRDEATQRAAVREIVRKLHARGIHAAGYMCAVSMFWQSMFSDVPQSVRWLMFNSQGFPYRYSGGRDKLRFIADVRNPDWIKYQEKRVGGMIDDGLDAIFFDNTGAPEWASNPGLVNFFTQIRSYIHNTKHSSIPLFSNFGISPSRAALNRFMNFTYDEGWHEPGVRGEDWDVSNIRRDRLLHAMLPSWKPVVSEYSIFHNGNRSSTFSSANSAKLSIAESAAFGTAYTWDMEGPFDAGLIAQDPGALATWSAISRYNGFLKNHSPLYVGAKNITPLVVVIPDNYKIGFSWPDSKSSAFFDLLSKHSVLYSVLPASLIGKHKLGSYSGVVVPFFSDLSSEQKHSIRDYVATGGKAYVFAESSDLPGLRCKLSSPALLDQVADNLKAQREILANLRSLGPGATKIDVAGPAHVLANVTSLDHGNRIIIHLLNYSPAPLAHVTFSLSVGKQLRGLIGKQPVLISPDSQTSTQLANVNWRGTVLTATLPELRTYGVVFLR
jgi:hypothetical protein